VLHNLGIWSLYFLAQVLVLLATATASAKSEHTPWQSVRGYLGERGVTWAWRVFFATMLFLGVWQRPEFVDHALQRLGLDWRFPFKLEYWSAGLFGLGSDKLVDIVQIGLGSLAEKAKRKFAAFVSAAT
jgi:hypothetical protein